MLNSDLPYAEFIYIIAGCNGAGKTTASLTILPEILNCKEFVNADNIAAKLSPFNPESVAFEAGRQMLQRISELMADNVDFAFETTLSARSYVSLVKGAAQLGIKINLLYFWLFSPKLAIDKVADRVSEGGHNIPSMTIERRYYRGIYNLLNLYIPIVDNWMVIDNIGLSPDVIAQGVEKNKKMIFIHDLWDIIQQQSLSHGK